MTRGSTLVLAVLLLAAGPEPVRAEPPALELLHLEGNVGASSAGHTALRVGRVVFHYQHDGDVFRLVRDPWDHFQLEYRGFQNRPIHVAALAADPPDRVRLYEHLTAEHLGQIRGLARRDAARRDLALLEALRAGEAVQVPVAGLLDPARAGDPDGLALRRGVAALLGSGATRRLAAEAEADLGSALASLGSAQGGGDRLAQRVRNALALREALRALDLGFGLAPDALFAAPGARLSDAEARSLAAFRDGLVQRAAALPGSARADRGEVLLRVIARHHALARSLAAGRLLLLDPYSGETRYGGEEDSGHRERELLALATHAERLFGAARGLLLAELPAERDLNLLEDLAARAHEYRRGASSGEPVRQSRERLVPARSRGVRGVVQGQLSFDAAYVAAGGRLLRVEDDVQARYGYDLVRENCVTELVRVMNGAFGGPAGAEAALGGRIEPGEGLGFIPRVFFGQVTERYELAARTRLPSHRELVLAALAEEEPRALVRLRESNIFTSSLYEPRLRDGSFVFFTSEAVWLRPLQGLANITWGLGQGLLGLVTAPFDRGRRLSAGTRGVLFSLPELAFANVRKGSFDATTLRVLGVPTASGDR